MSKLNLAIHALSNLALMIAALLLAQIGDMFYQLFSSYLHIKCVLLAYALFTTAWCFGLIFPALFACDLTLPIANKPKTLIEYVIGFVIQMLPIVVAVSVHTAVVFFTYHAFHINIYRGPFKFTLFNPFVIFILSGIIIQIHTQYTRPYLLMEE